MIELLSYHFFSQALVAAVFISITCGYIGTYIVSRRIVFVSGGISHASFGGVGIGYFMGINPIIGAAVFSIIIGLGIEIFTQRTSNLRKDSLIGMMWSLGMAIGIIFIYLTPGYTPNLMSYLFGNILTVSTLDLILIIALSLLTILIFKMIFKEIVLISFDQEYAQTQGIPVHRINLVMICLVALAIVFSIRAVGIILVISLLTVPQATANLISNRFKYIIIWSIIFGLFSSLTGLFISYFLKIPSGATIIFMTLLTYIMTKFIKQLKTWKNHARR